MTNTNPRDLIQQLAGLARRKHYTCEDSWYSCPQSEGGSDRNPGAECDCGADEHNAKVDAIWAALSLPETEGPTVMEIIELADEIEAEDLGQVDLVRRALARCGRPAVEPVPVSKRLPGEEDCDPSFQCWWFTPSEEKWILWPIKWAGPECSHWLPHYALPVPTTETP